MTAATWNAEPAIDLHSHLGEGPIWDHRTDRLAWVDVLAGLVHTTDPTTHATTSIPLGTDVGAVALLGDAGYLLAVREGYATLHGDRFEPERPIVGQPGERMNDGAVDPAGRFLAGTITDDRTPTGTLYSREPGGDVRTLFGGVTVSNGLVWSEQGDRLFYVDSARQSIDVMDYDIESGSVSDRRQWVEVPETTGVPDGLTIDAEGCLWLALWGGSGVLRYSPDAKLIGRVELPVSRVTSCAFGGSRLDRLYVTTAAVGSSRDDPPRPLDGALFVVETGATGVESTVAEA